MWVFPFLVPQSETVTTNLLNQVFVCIFSLSVWNFGSVWWRELMKAWFCWPDLKKESKLRTCLKLTSASWIAGCAISKCFTLWESFSENLILYAFYLCTSFFWRQNRQRGLISKQMHRSLHLLHPRARLLFLRSYAAAETESSNNWQPHHSCRRK